MRYYVYVLTDPRDGVVFYVGKGSGRRMYEHECQARRGVASPKCDRIRAIHQAGLQVEYRELARLSDECEAYARERKVIRRYGVQLMNLTCGGGGERNRIPWLRKWLQRVDSWRQNPRYLGPTFRGVKEGDTKAEAFVANVRKLVAMYDEMEAVA